MKKPRKQLTTIALIISVSLLFISCGQDTQQGNKSVVSPTPSTAPQPTAPQPQPTTPAQPSTIPVGAPTTMEVAKAVMVTVELDFGKGKLPTIADAVRQIERQY